MDDLIKQIAEQMDLAEQHKLEIQAEMERLEQAGMYQYEPHKQWQTRGGKTLYLYLLFRQLDGDVYAGPDGKRKLYVGSKPEAQAEEQRKINNGKMRDWEEKSIQQELRQQLNADIRRNQFALQRRKPGRAHLQLALEAEQLVTAQAQKMGYRVAPTTKNAPFDLWIWDERGAARVEVKISRYVAHKDGYGRYQAAIRNHQHDLLVFIARNGQDWPFVIPAHQVPNKHLGIYTYKPYTSCWAQYLFAWDYLQQAVSAGYPAGWQLPLL